MENWSFDFAPPAVITKTLPDFFPALTKRAFEDLLSQPPFLGMKVDPGVEAGSWVVVGFYKDIQYRLKAQFPPVYPSDVYDEVDNPNGFRGLTMEMAYESTICYLKQPTWTLYLTAGDVQQDYESGFDCPRIKAALRRYVEETFVEPVEEEASDSDGMEVD